MKKKEIAKILSAFPFADASSRAAAEMAIRPQRPAAFLISADRPGLGTSTLVRKFLASFSDNPACTPWPCSDAAMAHAIHEAAFLHGYLWLDHPRFKYRRKKARKAPTHVPTSLLAFLSSRRIVGRLPGTTEMYDLPNKVITFISGNCLAEIPDLARRCQIINLSPES